MLLDSEQLGCAQVTHGLKKSSRGLVDLGAEPGDREAICDTKVEMTPVSQLNMLMHLIAWGKRVSNRFIIYLVRMIFHDIPRL